MELIKWFPGVVLGSRWILVSCW